MEWNLKRQNKTKQVGKLDVGKGPRIDQKRNLLDSAAVRSSADAGGGTNIVVNAPSTSNSNSTVQKIDANPLMSNNPRRPSGVTYG